MGKKNRGSSHASALSNLLRLYRLFLDNPETYYNKRNIYEEIGVHLSNVDCYLQNLLHMKIIVKAKMKRSTFGNSDTYVFKLNPEYLKYLQNGTN